MLKGLAEDLAIKKAMLNARLRKRAEKQGREESSRRAGAGGSVKEGQEQEQHQCQASEMERAESKASINTNPQKVKSPLTSVEELVDAEANEALEIAALER